MIRLALWIHRWTPFGWPLRWAWKHAPDPAAPESVQEWWLNLAVDGKRIPQVPKFGKMMGRR
jgi:hypothetical protein